MRWQKSDNMSDDDICCGRRPTMCKCGCMTNYHEKYLYADADRMQGTEMDGGAAFGSAGSNEELSNTISHYTLFCTLQKKNGWKKIIFFNRNMEVALNQDKFTGCMILRINFRLENQEKTILANGLRKSFRFYLFLKDVQIFCLGK